MFLLVNAIEKLPSVTDLLNASTKNVENQKYIFQSCESCDEMSLWKQYCTNNFTEEELQWEIHYCQWMNNNCCTLECSKLSGTVSDVIKSGDERLEYYLICFHQTVVGSLICRKKRTFEIGQFLFQFDFSEKYSFVPQDEIQSRHWDHASCTLFATMVHLKIPRTIFWRRNHLSLYQIIWTTTNMFCQSFLT